MHTEYSRAPPLTPHNTSHSTCIRIHAHGHTRYWVSMQQGNREWERKRAILWRSIDGLTVRGRRISSAVARLWHSCGAIWIGNHLIESPVPKWKCIYVYSNANQGYWRSCMALIYIFWRSKEFGAHGSDWEPSISWYTTCWAVSRIFFCILVFLQFDRRLLIVVVTVNNIDGCIYKRTVMSNVHTANHVRKQRHRQKCQNRLWSRCIATKWTKKQKQQPNWKNKHTQTDKLRTFCVVHAWRSAQWPWDSHTNVTHRHRHAREPALHRSRIILNMWCGIILHTDKLPLTLTNCKSNIYHQLRFQLCVTRAWTSSRVSRPHLTGKQTQSCAFGGTNISHTSPRSSSQLQNIQFLNSFCSTFFFILN